MIDRDAWTEAVGLDRLDWQRGERCVSCGEWIGHRVAEFDGSRPRCFYLPTGVPIKEVRPGCYRVRDRYPSVAGGIRAMERGR